MFLKKLMKNKNLEINNVEVVNIDNIKTTKNFKKVFISFVILFSLFSFFYSAKFASAWTITPSCGTGCSWAPTSFTATVTTTVTNNFTMSITSGYGSASKGGTCPGTFTSPTFVMSSGVNSTCTITGAVTANACTSPSAASGTNATYYTSQLPAGACSGQSQTCTTGTWAPAAGSYQYSTCTAGCTGTPWGNVSSGYSQSGYASTNPAGPCTSEVRTCTAGTMSGSYTATSCTAGCPASTPCSAGVNGATCTAWLAANADTCSSTTRTCTGGAYNNTSYTNASCTTNSYTYNFSGNGATTNASPASVYQTYGSSISTPTSPSRTGYTFTGWSPAIPATMPSGGGTSTAQWSSSASAPSISTPAVQSISVTTVQIGATVTSLGYPNTITRGTCYGTSAAPTTNCLAEGGTTTGSFLAGRTNLVPSTYYYYRGYATNTTGTSYTVDGTFTTGAAVVTVTPSPTTYYSPPGQPFTISFSTTINTDPVNPLNYFCDLLDSSSTLLYSSPTWGATSIAWTSPAWTQTGEINGFGYYVRCKEAKYNTTSGTSSLIKLYFWQNSTPPTITSPTSSILAPTAVRLGASITLGYPARIYARGFCISTAANPYGSTFYSNPNCTGQPCDFACTQGNNYNTPAGTYNMDFGSLSPSTTYHYQAFATDNFNGNVVTSDTTFTTPVLPTGNIWASNCTVALGASSCTTTLTWNTTNPFVTSAVTTDPSITVATGNTDTTIVTGVKTYTMPWNSSRTFYLYNSGLLSQATATAWVACASGGTWNGSICAIVPTVNTPTASPVAQTTATTRANVVSLGYPATLTSRGTCIGTSASPTACTDDGGRTTGPISINNTGLNVNTTYYYRGYATNTYGTGYSSDGTFSTTVGDSSPTLSSPTAVNIGSISARMGATLTGLGISGGVSPASVTRGYCVSSSQTSPSLVNGATCNGDSTTWGTTLNAYYFDYASLSPSTTYYYCGYATGAGTGYSSCGNFRTKSSLTINKTDPSASATITSIPAGISCGATCTYYFPDSTSVTVNAPAVTGYTVAISGAGCTGSGGDGIAASCTSSAITSAQTITVVYTVTTRALTVSQAGNGSCTLGGGGSYNYGTVASPTASASTGSTFTGWSGSCSGSASPTSVTMNAAKTCTATCTLNTSSITISSPGAVSGTYNTAATPYNAVGTYAVNYGQTISVNCGAWAGYTLAVSGAGCTGSGGDSLPASCTSSAITSGPQTITCAYTIQPRTLTVTNNKAPGVVVTSSPAGSPSAISCGSTCTSTYNYSTSVTVTAPAVTGYTVALSNGCTASGAAGVGASCTFAMDAAHTVAVVYTIAPFSLSISNNLSPSVNVTSNPAGINCGTTVCYYPFNYLTSVTVTAPAVAGYSVTMSGGCSAGPSAAGVGASCGVTMSTAQSVTVMYSPQLTIVSPGGISGTYPSGAFTAAGAYIVNYSAPVTVNAAAWAGYSVAISGAGCTGSGGEGIGASCTSSSITSAQTITVTYTVTTRTLTVNKAGTGTGTIGGAGTYNYGDVAHPTAVADGTSIFSGWSGSCSGSASPTSVTMDAAKTCTATFTLNTFLLTVTNNKAPGVVVTSSPAGSPSAISCGSTCTSTYNSPTSVTVTAPAVTEYSVVLSNGCTVSGAAGVGTSCTFAMDAAHTVAVVYSDTIPPSQPGIMTTSWTGDHYVNTSFTAATTGSTDYGSGISYYNLCRSADNSSGCDTWVATGIGASTTVSGTNLPSTGAFRYYYWYAYDVAGNQSAASTGQYVRYDTNVPTITDIWATNAVKGSTVRFYVSGNEPAIGTQIGLNTSNAQFYLGTMPYSSWNRVSGGTMSWDGTNYYYDVTINDVYNTTYRAYAYVYDLLGNQGARDENPTEFTIANTPCPISTPTYPGNGAAINNGGNIGFTTNAVTDVDGAACQYYFRVATGSDAETGAVCNSGWQTSTSYTCNPGVGNYYWHVYTYDGVTQTNPNYVWSFNNNAQPSGVSVSPSSGSFTTGARTFTSVYTDPNGATDINYVHLLINTGVDGNNMAFYGYYVRSSNSCYLYGSDGNASWNAAPYTLPTGNITLNSCSSVAAGNTLTVTWNTTINTWNECMSEYLYVVDNNGWAWGWSGSNGNICVYSTNNLTIVSPGVIKLPDYSAPGTYSVIYGASPNITAQGWAGYTLALSGGCSASSAVGLDATCTISNMTTPQTVTATYTVVPYPLTVAKAGAGAGTITSSPGTINCGATCGPQNFNYGTAVTLTATPSTGSTFAGWSGGGCSGTGTCVTTITGAVTVTATFTLNTYGVTISSPGAVSGTYNTAATPYSVTGTYNVNYNQTISVTAGAWAGYTVAIRGAGCTGDGGDSLTASCTSSAITSAQTITVTYTIQPRTLTVNTSGNGTGTVGGAGAYNYLTVAGPTASAGTGSTFTGWSGSCSGSASPTSVTMDANKTCTATFTLNTFVLTIPAFGGTGSGTYGGTTAGTYNYGTAVSMTATPSAGSTFTKWVASGSAAACNNQTTSPCAFTMTGAASVQAIYAMNVPPAPTGLWGGPAVCNNSDIYLSWNSAATATTYQLYRGATLIYNGPLLLATDTGLSLATLYSYKIYATNAGGQSPASGTINVTTANYCTPTSVFTGTSWATWAGNGRDTLWGNDHASGSMAVYPGDTFALSWTSTDSTSCTIDGAAVSPASGGTNNIYSAGGGAWSHTYTLICSGGGGSVNKTINVYIPPTPTNFGYVCSGDAMTATVSWTAPSGYTLFYLGPTNIITNVGYPMTGTSYSLSVSPNTDYPLYIDTSASNGAWSSETDMNVRCNRTQVLTVTKAGNGTGTVTGAGTYNYNIVVNPTAVADAGSTFTGWSGSCSGSASPTSVTMDVDKTCTATFTDNPPTQNLTFSSASVNPDNTSQYTISLSGTDTGGASRVYNIYALINYQGANGGNYRGYLTWYPADAWPGYQDNTLCSGVGSHAVVQPGYGNTYVHLKSCNVTDAGNTRTVNFVVAFDSSFYTPTTQNDISGYVCDNIGQCNGWNNYDLNFSLIPMTPGSFYSTPASCNNIPTNSDVCSTNITWSTVNPQGTSAVTSDTGLPNPGNSLNAGTQSFASHYPSSTYYLYNNSVLLSTISVGATCTPNVNVWNPTDGKCEALGVTVVATPALPEYNRASSISWTSTNATACTLSGGGISGSGTSNAGVSTGVLIAAQTYTVSCTGNNGVSGISSVAVGTLYGPPNGTLNGSDCQIALNASTCNTSLTLNVYNPISDALTNVTKPTAVEVISNATINKVFPKTVGSIVVGYPSTTFYLNHDGVALATKLINATCLDGTWDGTICRKYGLTVTNNLAPTVVVTSNPAGISCGATCTANYNYNTSVTVTAPAIAGYSVAISNGCTATGGVGIGATCPAFNMTSNKTVAVVYSDGTPPTTPGIITTSWIGDHWVNTNFVVSTTGSTDSGSGIRGYRLCRSNDNGIGCQVWTANGEHAGLTEVVSGTDLPGSGAYRYYYWYAYDNSNNQSTNSPDEYVRMDGTNPIYNSTSFTGCNYENGNNCYVKNGTTFYVNISHTDNESGTNNQYFELSKNGANRGTWDGATGNIKSVAVPFGVSNGGYYTGYGEGGGMEGTGYMDIQNAQCIQTDHCNVTALGKWQVVAGSGASTMYGVTVYMYDQFYNGVGYTATSKYVYLDNTAPTVPTPTDAGAYSAGTSLTFTGTASDAYSGIASCSAQIDVNNTDGLGLAMGSTLVSANGSYTWTGAVAGNTYYYRYVCDDNVGNNSGWSPWSDGISINTIPTVTSPTVSAITPTTATLGANVTSLGIPSAISARGTCWGTTASPTTNCSAEGSTTSGIFTQARTGFTAGTTYYYRGYATNTSGTAYSADATFTTSPAPVTGLWCGASAVGNSNINLSWNAAPTATSYQLYRSATKIYDGALLLATDIGLSLATQYSYTIYASNASGQSSVSNTVSCTTANAITPVPSLTATTDYITNTHGPTETYTGGPVTLSWGTVASAASCTLSGGTLGTIAAATTGGSQATTAPSLTQTFTLSCTNSTGQIGTDTVTVTSPPIPTNVAFACSTDKLTANVSWTAPSGYTAFYLRTSFYDVGVNNYLPPGWNDNFIGTAVSIPIYPNTDNTYWMHTRNPNGASSNPVSLNLRCNRTQVLTVTKAGNGTGTVTGAGTYNYNTVVSPTAVADAGSTFTGWSGSCSGSASPTSVTMDVDKTCIATFTLNPEILTLNKAGTGTGTVGGAGTYNYGTVVGPTAVADGTSVFTGWSGSCSGTASPTSVTMDAAKTCTATFTLMTGTLTPTTGTCSIAANQSSCNPTLNWGTTNPVATSAVTATAITTPAYAVTPLVNVSGNSGNQSSLFVVPYGTRTFYLYNNSVQLATSTITASCAAGVWNGTVCGSYTVDINNPANGTVTAPLSRTVNYNDTTTFTITPNAGYTASASGCGGTLNGNTFTTIAISSSCSINVSYSIKTYSLNYSAGANGSISGTSSQNVNYGANGTAVTATPAIGYHFTGWSDDCTTSSTGGLITTAANGDRIHTFTSSGTFTPAVNCTPEVLVVAGGGGGGTYAAGAGGGAGGLIYNPSYSITVGSYTVTIGGGGTGGDWGGVSLASNGNNSVFGALTAIGGGAGGIGWGDNIGNNGGSGGGGSGHDGTGGLYTTAGGTKTVSQGNNGGLGRGISGNRGAGGGGGGAGGFGGDSSTNSGGNGGDGLPYSISGAATYYAGGAGGGDYGSSNGGIGGFGGGGNVSGGNSSSIPGGNGISNTGGGGGGSRSATVDSWKGGNGGSGIVIVRYPVEPAIRQDTSVTSVKTAVASFAITTYTVTASAGANGNITAPLVKVINYGLNTTYTVNANAGYIPTMSGTCGGVLSGSYPTYTYTTSAITADCTVIATFNLMTGSITPSAPTCLISADANNCDVNLSWATTNPITANGTQITTAYPAANTLIGTAANAGGPVVTYVPYNSRTFTLYNTNILLDTEVATSLCTGGTTWVASATATVKVVAAIGTAGACKSNATLTVTNNLAPGFVVTSSPVGISCGSTCTAVYNYGNVVTITAPAVAGYSVTISNGCAAGPSAVGVGTACAVTMNAAATVAVVYSPYLTVNKVDPSGSGVVTASSLVTYNSSPVVSASAVANYTIAITGACTGSSTVGLAASCTVTSMTTPQTVTVTYTRPTNNLTIVSPGVISGTYSATGTYAVLQGADVTINAAGWAGYYVSMSGGCIVAEGAIDAGVSCTITNMTAAKTVTVTYRDSMPTLTVTNNQAPGVVVTSVSSPAQTNISCGSTCGPLSYNYNTQITNITAPAKTGYTVAITGACTANGLVGASATCSSFNMTSNKSVAVVYTISQFLLTVTNNQAPGTVVTSSAGGSPSSISCGATCTSSYNYNTAVTVTAPAVTNYTATISGGCSAGPSAVNTGTSCVVTVATANTVNVTYTRPTNNLTIVSPGVISGTYSATGTYAVLQGADVTINAAGWAGYYVSMSGGCIVAEGAIDAGVSCTITNMTAAKTVTVTYRDSMPTLTVTNNQAPGVVVTSVSSPAQTNISCGSTCGPLSYNYNTQITNITAPAKTGYTVAITGACTANGLVGASATCSSFNMTSNKSVAVVYTIGSYTVTPSITVGDTTFGTITPNTAQAVNYNTNTSFTVVPNSGYLRTMSGTCPAVSLVGNVYTVGPITANCTVIATFDIMSATLTSDVGSCTIPLNANTCGTNPILTWGITNPIGTPTAITASGMTDINVTNTLATPQNGTHNTLDYVPYPSRIFYLYNNSISLVPAGVTVTSSCVAGTAWSSTATATVGTVIGTGACTSNLLTVTNNQAPGVVVTSSPAGSPSAISCGATCTSTYAFNTAVTVTAPAKTGYTVQISNGCTAGPSAVSVGTSCVVTMSASRTVAVVYTIWPFTVTATNAAGGTITAPLVRAVNYNTQTVYVITPTAGYLPSVSGTCGGTLVAVGIPITSYNYTTSAITADCTVTPTYTFMAATLSAAPTSCTIPLNANVCSSNPTLTWSITNPVGNTTAITAIGMTDINVMTALTDPKSGTSSTLDYVSYPSRLFHLYNNSIDLVTANVTSTCAAGTTWEAGATPTVGAVIAAGIGACTSYNLTVTNNQAPGVVVTGVSAPVQTNISCGATCGPLSYSSGTVVAITAPLKTGYTVAISNGCTASGAVGLGATCNVTMSAARTVAVVYTIWPFTVTPSIQVGDTTFGTISPAVAQSVNYNTTKAFTITPNSGYLKSVAGTCPAGSWVGNVYTTGAIVADCTVIAVFDLMNGTLTSDVSSCTIGFNASNCTVNPNLTWSITNPIGTPTSITATSMANIDVSVSLTPLTQNGTHNTSDTVPWGGRTFFLYNNGISLAQTTVTSSCATNSSWNGSICVKPTGLITASDCTITTDNTPGPCTSNLGWSTTNPIVTSVVTTPTNITVATANTGSTTYPVYFGTRTFYLYNIDGVTPIGTATATATCYVGHNVWNGTNCVPPTGTITAAGCTIPLNGTGCGSSIIWTTTNPLTGFYSAVNNVTNSTTVVASSSTTPAPNSNSGSVAITLTPINKTFALVHNGVTLASISPVAVCANTTHWNGTTCVIDAPSSGNTIFLVNSQPNSATIYKGRSATLTWDSPLSTSCSGTWSSAAPVASGTWLSSGGAVTNLTGVVISPIVTTNYTLRCTNASGTNDILAITKVITLNIKEN